jgi:hypothetical protein
MLCLVLYTHTVNGIHGSRFSCCVYSSESGKSDPSGTSNVTTSFFYYYYEFLLYSPMFLFALFYLCICTVFVVFSINMKTCYHGYHSLYMCREPNTTWKPATMDTIHCICVENQTQHGSRFTWCVWFSTHIQWMVSMVAGFHVVFSSLHTYSEWYPW